MNLSEKNKTDCRDEDIKTVSETNHSADVRWEALAMSERERAEFFFTVMCGKQSLLISKLQPCKHLRHKRKWGQIDRQTDRQTDAVLEYTQTNSTE